MGRRIRAGIIVEVIVVISAIVFSFAYFHLNLYKANQGFDIVLIMLWVFVAAVLLLVLWWRSLTHEEMRRRFYLSQDYVYNFEIGYAPMSQVVPDGDEFQLVSFLADSLVDMSYGLDVADTPTDFTPQLVISTKSFGYRKSGEEGIVIDKWKGDLQRIVGTGGGAASPASAGGGAAAEGAAPESAAAEGAAAKVRSYETIGSYDNARELAHLLVESAVFA